jgi:CHAT domain-containing protein
LECFNQALSVVQALNDHGGERFTLLLIGEFYSRWGDDQKALAYYGRALTLIRAGDGWEPVIRYGIARGERAQGNLAEAQSQIEAALAILESVRSKIASQQLRASYLASNRDFYEFYVDLLMRLHQRQPSDGHDAAAIEAGERARARSLLETLVEARADIRQGVDASLLERERNLQQRLNAKAERLTQLLSGKHTEEQAVAAKKEVEDLLTQYQEVQAQIRYTSPRYAALTQPQPLGLKEIQQQVLDDDTLLLEYALGEERSFLWAVTPTSISSFELPKRAEIETVARRVYDLMKVSNIRADKEQTEMRTALSRMLLGPVAGQLGKKRLLIVADGALQFVPFAALPKPVNSGQWTVDSKRKVGNCSLTTDHCPLILDHEIVSLPSASVLAVLRREVAGRQPAAKLAAVLADPVFEKNDPRVKARDARRKTQDARPKTSDSKKEPAATDANPQSAIRNPQPDTLTRSARQVGLNGFRRLAQSRREADALVALTPAGQSLKAVDFDASKPVALSKALSQYRIVHFATHGLVNSEHPELSGLVLSLVNEQGEAQDGFLRLHDIYNLGLGADLVVLSACQTALGKEIKGEGLVGLTRGFMYAGATGVAASLWDVSDLGGARLMKRFYEGLLKKGLKPAAALRAAQLSLWKEARWKPAYYWAGFLFQGEWK